METATADDRLINLDEVRRLIPISRSSVWKWSRRGAFPSPVRLPGSRRVAWRASEIRTWIAERPALAVVSGDQNSENQKGRCV